MPRCPNCDELLPSRGKRYGARCPYCRGPLFEGADRYEHTPRSGDGQCVIHPQSAAVGTCHRCGNYLCPVCDTRWRRQAWCIACVDRALEVEDRSPEEARAHRRQAMLALIFGLASWGIVILVAVVVLIVVASSGPDSGGGAIALALGIVMVLVSGLLSLQGVGQGAAAVRTRGDHLIMATAGLILSALHIGLVFGFLSASMWQN